MAMERERENPCCPSVSSDNSWLKRSGQRRISMTHVAWMHPLKIRLEYRGQQLWHKPMWTCMILHNYVPGVLSRSLSFCVCNILFRRYFHSDSVQLLCKISLIDTFAVDVAGWATMKISKVFHPWQLDDAGWMLEAGCSGPAAIWNTTTDDHVHRAGPGSSLERCRLDLIWLG